jgi:MerR family transcriptional regulator, light-induced transcriptional regulator
MDKYNIQIVSQITGISAHTLRAWEKRYQIIEPDRNDTGRRLYSQSEIEKLQVIKSLIETGQTIGVLAKLDHAARVKLLQSQKNQSEIARDTTQKIKVEFDYQQILQNILMALHNYKLDIIAHEFAKCINQISAREFAFKIIIPLFKSVGEMVYNNKFSVSQEHSLSAITTFYIGKLVTSQTKRSSSAKNKICLATPQGELHSLGILIAALLCHHHEVEFIYLGEDMPAASIAEAAKSTAATHLILGVMNHSNRYSQYNLTEYLNQLISTLPVTFEIWIGGPSEEIAPFQIKGYKVLALASFEELEQKLKFLK